MTLIERCKKIRLLLSDIDGVMTDGRLTFDNSGIESKSFSIRDGMGIRLWQQAGHEFGLVTGRKSQIVERRAAELDIKLICQGNENKWPIVEAIAKERGLSPDEIAYIGDDLPDLAVVNRVGLGVAVADAVEELQQSAGYVTSVVGGRGAVREVVQLILQNTDRWDEVIERYS